MNAGSGERVGAWLRPCPISGSSCASWDCAHLYFEIFHLNSTPAVAAVQRINSAGIAARRGPRGQRRGLRPR